MAPTSIRGSTDVVNTSLFSLSTILRKRSLPRRLSETYTPPIIPTTYSDTDTGLSPGATAGIVLGSVCGILCICWLLYICFIKNGSSNSPPSKPSKRAAQQGRRKHKSSKHTRPRADNSRSRYQPKTRAKRPVSRAPPIPVAQTDREPRKKMSEVESFERRSFCPYPESSLHSEDSLPANDNEIVVIVEPSVHSLGNGGGGSSRRSRESRRTQNTTKLSTYRAHSSDTRSRSQRA